MVQAKPIRILSVEAATITPFGSTKTAERVKTGPGTATVV
jgi:hypothetical protein